MRKIKSKNDKLKDKHIAKIYDSNKAYYLLTRCMLELPLAIRVVFGISKNTMLDYVKNNVKIEYKSELLKDEWYKGLTTCLNRWLKLSERIKVPIKDFDISMTKYVEDRYIKAMTLQVASIQEKYIKERVHYDDNPMAQACTLVALLYMIDMLLKHDKLYSISPKDLKYMRWLCSTYRDTLGAILYDIDSYKGYCYTFNKIQA